MWMSREPLRNVAKLWQPIAEQFAEHGLWPLVLDSLDGDGDRPWGDGELDPVAASDPGSHDAARVLEEMWSAGVPVPEEDDAALAPLHPFDRTFPGLAQPTDAHADAGAFSRAVGELRGALGLVATTRPADALALLGWQGAVNHDADPGMLSAVLRSWEDRFGAYLIGVGFDTITLAVTRPPRSMAHARAIAAEHFAICSDCIHQGSGTIEDHASSLVDAHAWSFWWD